MAPVRVTAVLEAEDASYRLVVEDYVLEGGWRLGDGLAGRFRVRPDIVEVDVTEGVGGEIVRALRGKGRIREMIRAARLLSCATGRPVLLRLHGRRVAQVDCG